MTDTHTHESILKRFDEMKHEIKIFMNGVVSFIGEHPTLTAPRNDIVHSYKSKLKDRESLRKKITRKIQIPRNGAIAIAVPVLSRSLPRSRGSAFVAAFLDG